MKRPVNQNKETFDIIRALRNLSLPFTEGQIQDNKDSTGRVEGGD